MKEKLRIPYGRGMMVFGAAGVGFFLIRAIFTFPSVNFAFNILAVIAAILAVVVGYKVIKKEGVKQDEKSV